MQMTIPIEPVGQLRPRATRYGRGIRFYDPKKVAKFKKDVGEYVIGEMNARNLKRFNGKPLKVILKIFRPIQQSISNRERSKRLSHVHRPQVKSDLDNYIKSILDALNGIIWDDDRNIVSIVADKYYAEDPRIEIEVEDISNE